MQSAVISQFAEWISHTLLSKVIVTHEWIIPSTQSVRYTALAVLFPSAGIINLRILGLISGHTPLTRVARRFASGVRIALMVMVITGPARAAALASLLLWMLIIVAVDLRLLGLASREQPLTQVTDDFLPWTWGAFIVAAISGLMLFSSTPIRYFDSTLLRIKFLFMFLAGVKMPVVHFFTCRDVGRWNTGNVIPASAKMAGGLSLLLWTLVIFFGRWVGFTL